MKQILTTCVAALVGAVLGALSTSAQAPSVASLQVRELLLVDDSGRPLARLGSANGGASLTFLDRDQQKSVEIGSIPERKSQFVRFYGKENRVVAAIQAAAPNREATLYLGDEMASGRAIIGAMQSDDPGAPVVDWGIRLRGPFSGQRLFALDLHDALTKTNASMQLMRQNGTTWVVK